MSRRLAPLTGEAVESLPAPCVGCLFWELGEPPPDVATAPPGDALTRKQAWVSARVLDGQPPGRVAIVDGEVAGFVLFAPGRALTPPRPPLPRPSPDALVLASLRVADGHRGHGIGRLLVQAAIREAIAHEQVAVEAYGDRRWRDRTCVLPAGWLLHEGFSVHHEHPRYPLLRLDTRRTVRWADSLEHALEEVVERLPLPRRAPAPSPREPAITPER